VSNLLKEEKSELKNNTEKKRISGIPGWEEELRERKNKKS